jgi:hypothetical protein
MTHDDNDRNFAADSQLPISRDALSASAWCAVTIIINGILVSTPRINTLSDWSLRRGAPQIFIFWWGTLGAPRLSDQSDRVFILGVETKD